MDPLPIFEPGDMPSMVGANVELAADVEERPKKYIRGASARVPAWTFGQGWAKQTFPSTWHNQMISGTFSRMIEPEYGLFVWDDGDAPAEQKTLLEYVKDDNAGHARGRFLFKGVHALHNARQALFLLRGVLRKQVPRGISGLDATLMREVKLEVKTADEFDLLFMSARASRDELVAKNPKKQQTYSGDAASAEDHLALAHDAKQWAEYIGAEGAVFTKHGFDEKLCVGVIPTGVLKKGLGDDDAQTAWHGAQRSAAWCP
ncbi:glutathione transferase [Aureococcus anophagefferens]|nr:glutathione transferase [Aureococcus anophagefferens]